MPVVCGFLATAVGLTSTLLFLPNQAWITTGETEFYLGGTESDLWPQHLTVKNIGPNNCTTDVRRTDFTCLHGGLNELKSLANRDYRIGFIRAPDKTISDWGFSRVIHLSSTNWEDSIDILNSRELWAHIPHGAIIHMETT